MAKYIGYKVGVKIEEKIKWFNLYDYKCNANRAKRILHKLGFKKEDIIIQKKEIN